MALREAARGGNAYRRRARRRLDAGPGRRRARRRRSSATRLIAGTMLVYLSSVSRRLDATALAGAGFAAALVKPVRPSALVEVHRRRVEGAPFAARRRPVVTRADHRRRRHRCRRSRRADAATRARRRGRHHEPARRGEDAREARLARGRVRQRTRGARPRCGQLPYDVILLDCRMPFMNGFEFARAVRQMDKPISATPIVGVSASAMPSQRQDCLDAGMDDFISKPLMMADLAPLPRPRGAGRCRAARRRLRQRAPPRRASPHRRTRQTPRDAPALEFAKPAAGRAHSLRPSSRSSIGELTRRN